MPERKHSVACENAKSNRCECSCRGLLHGVGNIGKEVETLLAYEKELRKEYTEKALRELEERYGKTLLTEIAGELGLDLLVLCKHTFEIGHLRHLIRTAIRELRTSRDLLQRKVKRLQKQRDDDYQSIMGFIKGEQKANEKRN